MKNDLIYPYYLVYLKSRLIEGKISKGSLSLLKISKSAFDDFKYKFNNDELYNSKIIELYKVENRDKKIDNLFNDTN